MGSAVTVEISIRRGTDIDVEARSFIKLVTDVSLRRRSPTFSLVQTCHSIHKKTPLILVAEGGHNRVLRLLLQDANFKASGSTAIHLATLNGHAAAVGLLLPHDPTWFVNCATRN